MRLGALLVTGLLVVVGSSTQVLAQATAFDGNYGNADGSMGTGSKCNTTRFGYRLTVKNGQASMRTATAGTLEGEVHPDGTIDIIQGRALLKGRLEGPKFTGLLSMGSECQFSLNYNRF